MLTKEQAAEMKEKLEAIELPSGLDLLLAHRISARLRKAGIYFQLFRRYKTNDSILHKLDEEIKEGPDKGKQKYNDGHLIQDKIGLKYVFYFVDDLEIAKEIVEKEYQLIEWANTKDTPDVFAATKINGVFRIPEEALSPDVRKQMRACYIDDTFEIQLKTMLFQSWHETDHDLRYKNEDLWTQFPEMNRKLNRVLATLELCDSSVNSVFEKLTYRSYKWVKEKYSDQPYSPALLERIAQTHFRIQMKSSFAPERDQASSMPKAGNPENAADITENNIIYDADYGCGIMRDHFRDEFKFLRLSDPAEKADAVTAVFSSTPFLKTVIKYSRSRLIRGFLEHKNDVPITIFNICAMIYTRPSSGEPEDRELADILKRYLRKQHHKRPKDQKYFSRQYQEYATYQCFSDVYPTDESVSIHDTFIKTLSHAASWLCIRFACNEESSDSLKKLKELSDDLKTPGYTLPLEILISESEDHELRLLYLEKEKACAIRIIEPDNKYENSFREDEKSLFMENRTFITDVGIRDAGDHVELTVRCSCKEPKNNIIVAAAYRPAFLTRILMDTENLYVTEHGVPKRFRWDCLTKSVFEISRSEEDLASLLSSSERQLPLAILPQRAADDLDFYPPGLARSLAGYGHLVLDSTDQGSDVRLYWPGNQAEPTIIHPDRIDDKDTYVYMWQEVHDRVVKYPVKRKMDFGKVKFYRELKNVYYQSGDETSVVTLKNRIENLERELKELREKTSEQ